MLRYTYMLSLLFFYFFLFLDGNLYDMLFDPETDECSGLPVDQCVYYLQQILFAVHYLHQHNTLHLDLKC